MAKPVLNMACTKYVNGLTLYMKIQKPGKALLVAKIPQKFKHITNNKLAVFAALSAKSLKAAHT